MRAVDVYIMWGLGREFSNGIIYDLAARLEKIPGVSVRVGGFDDYQMFADKVRATPLSTAIVQVGHSLAGSVAGEFARRAVRPIDAIFGIDPADNVAANGTQYANTPIPPNVAVANAIYVEGGLLGGGTYRAEDETATAVFNEAVPDSHTKSDEAIEDHLMIGDFVSRLAEEAAV